MTQPRALYLADVLEDAGKPADITEAAAAELRRLHAENQELREEVAELRAWLEVETGRVKQAIAAEREACAKVCDTTPPYPFRPSIEAAHAIRARGNT